MLIDSLVNGLIAREGVYFGGELNQTAIRARGLLDVLLKSNRKQGAGKQALRVFLLAYQQSSAIFA